MLRIILQIILIIWLYWLYYTHPPTHPQFRKKSYTYPYIVKFWKIRWNQLFVGEHCDVPLAGPAHDPLLLPHCCKTLLLRRFLSLIHPKRKNVSGICFLAMKDLQKRALILATNFATSLNMVYIEFFPLSRWIMWIIRELPFLSIFVVSNIEQATSHFRFCSAWTDYIKDPQQMKSSQRFHFQLQERGQVCRLRRPWQRKRFPKSLRFAMIIKWKEFKT